MDLVVGQTSSDHSQSLLRSDEIAQAIGKFQNDFRISKFRDKTEIILYNCHKNDFILMIQMPRMPKEHFLYFLWEG